MNKIGEVVPVQVGIGVRAAMREGTILGFKPGTNQVLIRTQDKRVLIDGNPPSSNGGYYTTHAFCAVDSSIKSQQQALKTLGYRDLKIPA